MTSILEGLDGASLGPNVAKLASSGAAKEKGMEHLNSEAGEYRIPVLSDKFHKSSGGDNPLTTWSFPFQGGSSLSVHPVGSFGHLGNAGLANRHANGGDVLPMLDVAVLIDANEGGEDGFVGGKDYLNHRYTDKRNMLAVHIAKQLSQKKHRAKVGAVHLTNVFGDSRKVGLVLTPSLDSDGTESNKKDKKKRKRKDDKGKAKASKNNKLRFRIRLIFGVKQEVITSPSPNQNESDDEYSSDEEMEYALASWIPYSRLLPNRNNNRSEKQNSDTTDDASGTPHYNNAIAEDLHLLSTTSLINSTISSLTSHGSNVSPVNAFHETLLLLKVWALQRGLLRGHDSFTTTTLGVLLVYLYRTKVIGKRMGCVQGFTAFMKFWSEADWLGDNGAGETSGQKGGKDTTSLKKKVAFVIPTAGKNEAQTIKGCKQAHLYVEDVRGNSDIDTPKTLLECYKVACTSTETNNHVDCPILLDPTMTLNYLARLSPAFMRESKSEATMALAYIHGQQNGGAEGSAFQKLFLETNRFWTRYDAYVRVPLSSVPKLTNTATADGGSSKKKGKGKLASKVWGNDTNDLGYNESVCRGVVGVLGRALGDRVSAIRIFTTGNGDIRANNTPEGKGSGDDVATNTIMDSDQAQAVPIRGTSTVGYATRHCYAKPPVPNPSNTSSSSAEEPSLILGLRIDPTTSRRIVDRGPPAEDLVGSQEFVALWGESMAQLRRFQDGAIVRAVVWNAPSATPSAGSDGENVQFNGMDRSMGGIVERIVQHIVKLHFTDAKLTKKKKSQKNKLVSFELRNMISFIDGIVASPSAPSPLSDSLTLHKNVMTAFESLAEFLRQNTKTSYSLPGGGKKKTSSNLGLPLSIDEVEPLSACLRYSELFPPVPHPLLGGPDVNIGSSPSEKRKVSGANVGTPILIQIRFEGSSKWPTSLNAMGAAKCAMLLQLAEGIEKMKADSANASGGVDLDAFDGPIDVTPNALDIGYCGYSWRIIVRADQELRMLKGLRNPTFEAKALQLNLINRHVRGSMHHSLIHAIHTRHPSASSVVRLAHRWVASHMLSDMIPPEAIELLIAEIYTEGRTGSAPPSTVVAGFLRWLRLLSTHDWVREPLIVDPQNHITSNDRSLIHSQFNSIRGPNLKNGPAMYIISPADYDGVEAMAGSKVETDAAEQALLTANSDNEVEKVWAPTVTAKFPEIVVLSRTAALAKCSHDHLTSCTMRGNNTSGENDNGWVAAFQESSASLTSYSALLRVDSSYVADVGCLSTNADCAINTGQPNKLNEKKRQLCGPFEKSLQKRYAGPKELRKKHYKNLVLEKDMLHEWQPVKSLVHSLRSKYSKYAVFFYNEFAPDVIAMIWRPDAFKPQPFSAIVSEFKRPDRKSVV